MRRSLIFVRAAIVGTAVLVVIAATGEVASAGSVNHSNGGVPGATNCAGLTEAFVAQGNFSPPGTDINIPGPGIGNVASQLGVSVKAVQAGVRSYCATGIIP